jgi:macrodomain Ter protein organizer (MatP/YcbG family)
MKSGQLNKTRGGSMITVVKVKDLRVSKTYSLRQSKHDALRLIAAIEGHNNATAVLDRMVEQALRARFGKHWKLRIEEDLADDGEDEYADLEVRIA